MKYVSRQAMDTSAVLKLYRSEPNSQLVRACIDSEATLILSELVRIEVVSATLGLVRQGIESLSEADRLIEAFDSDYASYVTLPFDGEVIHEAERLLLKYASTVSLRPMDAFHLATALIEHGRNPLDSFVTTDKVLISIAKIEGLVVKP